MRPAGPIRAAGPISLKRDSNLGVGLGNGVGEG